MVSFPCSSRSSPAAVAVFPCFWKVAFMLIDSLTFALEKSGCLENFWSKLDTGADATLAVAASARPFLVAARFAHRPQPTLVVVAGEDEATAFARSMAAYLGEERVLRFPQRADYPFQPTRPDPRIVGQRMEAAWRLASGCSVAVVASAAARGGAAAPGGEGGGGAGRRA